ncbi:MAG: hypothetical protein ACOX6P_04195 [Candidatus Merdivicinus sp.]|jgi:hypothetical protein
MNFEHPLHFFLGANSPSGFVSFSDQLTSMTEEGLLFPIKGGPGTGKSTLMRTAAQFLSEQEPFFEYIHCSSDPDSLDAVIFPDSGIAIADATPPHVIEPQYPGACESVVNLCACWDEEILQQNRMEILSLCKQNSACHQQCVRFLSAAHSLLADNTSIALACTDTAKIAKTAANIVARECRRRRGESVEKRRLLTAVTPKGNIALLQTLAAFPRIYYIKDPYGAASNLLLTALRALLMECGVTIYTCFCPLNPYGKIDHLLIPELGLAFVTGSRAIPLESIPEPYRVISFSRFTDMEALSRRKQRLRFNRRAADEILDAAVRSLRRAKNIHDRIEEAYGKAVDFEAVQEISALTIEKALFWQNQILHV